MRISFYLKSDFILEQMFTLKIWAVSNVTSGKSREINPNNATLFSLTWGTRGQGIVEN